MMLGAVAQQPEPHTWRTSARVAGGGNLSTQIDFVVPPTAPDATATFDFVNNAYDWNGTGLTIGQVTDQSGWRTANGLEVPASGGSASLIYNDATTLLGTCEFTILMEIEVLDTAHDPYLLIVANSGDSFYIALQYITSGTDEWFADDNDGNSHKFCDHVSPVATGIHKVAFTRTNSLLSISADGNATTATTDSANALPVGGFPMAHFYIGGWGTNNGAMNIRSISFYDAQTDNNVLPLLSAP